MGRKNVAPAPSNALDHATKGYVDGAVNAALKPTSGYSSFVIGPTNTLQVPGLYISTDANGVPTGFLYDDHNGTNGSNSDGQVGTGQTNPLTKPGLWLQQDSNGNYIGLVFYDGKN